MSKGTTGVVELRFASGDPITAWESFTLRQDFTDPLGSFSFVVSPPKDRRNEYRVRLLKGSEVSIHIDGARQATAIITTVEQEIGRRGYSLSLECKSTLVTAYEASVSPYIAETFQSDTPISNVVLEALGPYGFDSIVTDAAGDVAAITGKSLSGRAAAVTLSELKHQDVRSSNGQSAYAFCAALFTRLGLVLRTNNEGKLLLSAPDFDQDAAYTLVQGTGSGDRMLADPPIRIRDTNDGQYSETVVLGRGADRPGSTSASAPIGGVYVSFVDRPSGCEFEDATMELLPTGRHDYLGPWKPRYYLDKKARDVERCQNVATLIHGATARRAYAIHCAVDGLISTSGKCVWATDTVVRVKIDELQFDEDMWILETVKTGNRSGGQLTHLTLIPLDSLVLGG